MKRLIVRGVAWRAETSGCQISNASTNFGESRTTKPGRSVNKVTLAQMKINNASTGSTKLDERPRPPGINSARSFVATGVGVGDAVGDGNGEPLGLSVVVVVGCGFGASMVDV